MQPPIVTNARLQSYTAIAVESRKKRGKWSPDGLYRKGSRGKIVTLERGSVPSNVIDQLFPIVNWRGEFVFTLDADTGLGTREYRAKVVGRTGIFLG